MADGSVADSSAAPSDTSAPTEPAEDTPEIFGSEIPVPEGATFKSDGFAIGSDGPRTAEFTLDDADKASALDGYKSTLEADGFAISREQPGRGYVAKKGDLSLQVTSRMDYYEDDLVILSIIYTTEAL